MDYLRKSVNQVLLGNFTKDVTLLGTVAQIALGLTDADLPGDLRDLTYDLIHWKWTPEHGIQTLLDVVGVLPIIGALKYSDEFSTLLKSLKKADGAAEAAELFVKNAYEIEEAVTDTSKYLDDIAEGAGNKIDVSLQYKEGWSSEQKAAADAKLKALSEANTVKTPVNRSGTSARAIYKRAYGNNSILQGLDIDHKIDLQLGGIDKLEYLWPLDQSVNRSLGKQINNYIKNYPIGTIFGEFSIK